MSSVASIVKENTFFTPQKVLYTFGIARAYHQLLPVIFKQFSLATALRTALPTLGYYVRRPSLPASEKPALFTMNILPPMMTVWYHLARKYLGNSVDITIFDCSGRLQSADFPGATVQKFLNFYASTKSDEFLYSIARNRKIGWICDDDVFFVKEGALDLLQKEFAIPNTASVSFKERPWWEFEIDGKRIPVSSSYCIAFNRDIFVTKEHLSLAPAPGNTHPSRIAAKSPTRFDTGDKANEILLKKGYRCALPESAPSYIAPFTSISGAVVMLWHFRKPEQVLDFFLSPPKESWKGTLLYGTLSAFLSICTIQECYQHITGKRYPLPSLPSRKELEKIRDTHKQYLSEGRTYEWVDDISERIRQAL